MADLISNKIQKHIKKYPFISTGNLLIGPNCSTNSTETRMEMTRKEADIYSYVVFLYTIIVFVNKLV